MPTVLGVLGTWECVSSVLYMYVQVFSGVERGEVQGFFFIVVCISWMTMEQ